VEGKKQKGDIRKSPCKKKFSRKKENRVRETEIQKFTSCFYSFESSERKKHDEGEIEKKNASNIISRGKTKNVCEWRGSRVENSCEIGKYINSEGNLFASKLKAFLTFIFRGMKMLPTLIHL
jgi:hypothetical protein